MVTLHDDRAFGAIFERAADGILLADDDGRYVRVNPAAETLTGYSNEELRAMTVFDLTPLPSKEAGLDMWRAFIRQGTLSGEYALTRKDGSHVAVEFQAVASIIPGIHLAIVRDVTARRQEERRLRRAESLQKATAALSAAVDAVQVAEVALAAGLASLDAQAGHVVAVVEGGREVEVVTTLGMEPDCQERWAELFRSRGTPPRVMGGRYRFSLDAPTLLVEAFRRRDAIGVDQVVDLGVSRSAAGPSASVRATACLPLVVSETLVGGLYLFWTEKRSLVEDERTFAGTLADLCAQALDRARLFTLERDARERAVASERSILEYQGRLQRMAFDRVLVEERERRRVATALHDGVTQYLARAKMMLDPVRLELRGADRAPLDAAVKLISAAIDETRSLSFELSPPILYELGIRAALSWLGERLESETGVRIEIADDGTCPSLDDVTASVVYRTVRELLTNTIKHAHCAMAKVSVRQHPDSLEIVVEDQGTGFDPSKLVSQGGFGLMSVREQIGRLGGTMDVASACNEGTRVRIRVPSLPRVPD